MSIPVIDTITSLGNYPVVDASNVQAGSVRLNVALNNKLDKSDVDDELNKKVDKEYGKSLSSNDYTTSDKNKLAGIAEGATKTIVDDTLIMSSINPVQNKAIVVALSNKADNSTVSSVSNRISDVETNQESLSARMDTFTTLSEGSTTGDAELADGRIGSDGTTYNNIGDAIRSQVVTLKSDINVIKTSTTNNDPNFINNLSKTQSGNLNDNSNIYIYNKKIPKGSCINSVTLVTSQDYNKTYSKIYVVTIVGTNVTILKSVPISSTGTTTLDYLANSDVYVGICGTKSTKYSTDTTGTDDKMSVVSLSALNNLTPYEGLVMLSNINVDVPSKSDVYSKSEVDEKISEVATVDTDYINNYGKVETGKSVDNDNIFIFNKYVESGKTIASVDVKASESLNQTYSKVYLCTVNGTNVSVLATYPITTTGHVVINYKTTTNTYVGICGSGATKYSIDTTGTDDKMSCVSRTLLNNLAARNDLVLLADVKVKSPLSQNVYTKSETDDLINNAVTEKVMEVGVGKEYTNLAAAVYLGVKTPNTKIIVYPGTYDFVQELATLDTQNTTGLTLYNNIHIKFMPGAKIVCNYTGSNTFINEKFSVFGADLKRENSSFTLEDVVIEAKNIRYCIHDEMHNGIDAYYKHVYKNCIFKLDNSSNPVWSATQCIGGGFGINGNIEVTNCVLETAQTSREDLIALSWHNNDVSYCENKLTVSNCRMTGTASFMTLGTSPVKTKCIINNCSMGSDIIIDKTDGTDNIEVVAYCNEVRN